MRTLSYYIHISNNDVKNEITKMRGINHCEICDTQQNPSSKFCYKCGNQLIWKRIPITNKKKIEDFPHKLLSGYFTQQHHDDIIIGKKEYSDKNTFDDYDDFPIEISSRKIERGEDEFRQTHERLIDDLQDFFGCVAYIKYGIL